jgi:hypothetical protein
MDSVRQRAGVRVNLDESSRVGGLMVQGCGAPGGTAAGALGIVGELTVRHYIPAHLRGAVWPWDESIRPAPSRHAPAHNFWDSAARRPTDQRDILTARACICAWGAQGAASSHF